MLDVSLIRNQFPILNVSDSSGRPLVYLDNAATTQKPFSVIETLSHYYQYQNSNIHRGIYELADQATRSYESARSKVASFINASPQQVIFCRGTTEAVNMVAHGWGGDMLSEGDEVLVTAMEHHSNYVPWKFVCQRSGARFRELALNQNGTIDLSLLDQALNKNTKLLAVTEISNTTGAINPLPEIVELAHKNQTLVMVDGAQSIGYHHVDMQALDCDFFAFSGHKIYGPTGIGVLYGKSEHLLNMSPYQQGGSMIHQVSHEEVTFKPAPHKFEAGTPPVAQAIGLGSALDFVEKIGRASIRKHAESLRKYTWNLLTNLEEVVIYGPEDPAGAIISFNVKGVHPHDVATILAESGVAVRAGHHCTQPLMKHFGIPGTVRASFGIYNNRDEIDAMVHALSTVTRIMQT